MVVPPGITVLLGPSGAGKSTTLSAIAGLVRPDQGLVRLGAEVWHDERGERVPVHRRRVALVFQSLALFPHLSSLENAAYGVPMELTGEARRELARAALERMGAAHLASRLPPSLSGGEAQRVALARALAMQPRALLLDEPLSGLDTRLRARLAAELVEVASSLSLPVLWVTHLEEEARAASRRALLLRGGRVVAEGEPDELARWDDKESEQSPR